LTGPASGHGGSACPASRINELIDKIDQNHRRLTSTAHQPNKDSTDSGE
jgi:hypothetical protein